MSKKNEMATNETPCCCPHCGHCGKEPVQAAPYWISYPVYYPQPYYPSNPYMTTTRSSGNSCQAQLGVNPWAETLIQGGTVPLG